VDGPDTEALEGCIAAMRAAGGITEGARILQRAGLAIGLPVVAVIHDISLPHGPSDEDGVKLSDIFGWPESYKAHWEARGNTFHDPVSLRARLEHLPFYWAAGAAGADGAPSHPSARSARITRELGSLGLCAAFIVPLHLPRGRVAVVGWWGAHRPGPWPQRLTDAASAPLLILSHYFLDLLRRRAPDLPKPCAAAELSAREIQSLTLAAGGLTDGEMAQRLGVSSHTIRFHLVNAAAKLGARNRTHAVGLAAQLGMIGLIDDTPTRLGMIDRRLEAT
jgi:DNA-binding CsgD family transcriptional regulator